MKLYAQLMMLSVAGRADGLDPGFNKQRPKLNPASANAFSSIADFLPGRVKFDRDLYDRIDKKYFGAGRAAIPTADDGTHFECGQNSMALIVDTTKFDGLDTVEKNDFSLLSTGCNATMGYVAWEAVTDDATGDSVELLVVDVPLDDCGTVAMYDEENDKIVFTNTVRNGAYSVNKEGDTHNGITRDSIIDFGVKCSYDAVYSDVDLQTNAEHSSLEKAINDGLDHRFEIGISFKKEMEQAESGRTDGMMEFEDFEGDAQYTVGDPAYFMIAMEHPNSAVYLQVESCMMVSGLTPLMNYTIVDDQCGDPFTNAKVVDNYEHGTSLVSFTMFEFVSDIPKTVSQDNTMKCNVKLCLVDEPCPVNDAC